MSAEIINLRQVRKLKERAAREADAAANRAKYGQTKSDRQLSDAERERNQKVVDNAYRPGPDDDLDPGTVS